MVTATTTDHISIAIININENSLFECANFVHLNFRIRFCITVIDKECVWFEFDTTQTIPSHIEFIGPPPVLWHSISPLAHAHCRVHAEFNVALFCSRCATHIFSISLGRNGWLIRIHKSLMCHLVWTNLNERMEKILAETMRTYSHGQNSPQLRAIVMWWCVVGAFERIVNYARGSNKDHRVEKFHPNYFTIKCNK